jgi:hypothetical protein
MNLQEVVSKLEFIKTNKPSRQVAIDIVGGILDWLQIEENIEQQVTDDDHMIDLRVRESHTLDEIKLLEHRELLNGMCIWNIKGPGRISSKVNNVNDFNNLFDLLRFRYYCETDLETFVDHLMNRHDDDPFGLNITIDNTGNLSDIRLIKVNFTLMKFNEFILNFHFIANVAPMLLSIRFEAQIIVGGFIDRVDYNDHTIYEMERVKDDIYKDSLLPSLLILAQKRYNPELPMNIRLSLMNLKHNIDVLIKNPHNALIFGLYHNRDLFYKWVMDVP